MFGWVRVQNRRDYEDLATELTTLSESLKQHIEGSSSALLSDSAANTVMSMQRQVEEIQDRLRQASGGGIREAGMDEEMLVRHYRQVQAYFRLLQSNASMSIWRTVDEQLVNTRLEGLKPAKEATYDSSLSTVVGRRTCTEGTRTKVLAGLDDWLYDSNSLSIYWMNGMAGTGKTTIASTFCERAERRKVLAASFFCTRSSAECKDVTRIVPTIAYLLARYSIPFCSQLCQILAQSPDLGTKNVLKQFEQLLTEPLKKAKDSMPEHLVVVIDALDECENRAGVELILDMLLRFASEVPLKFLITSRPEPEIYEKLIGSGSRQVIHLHEIEKSLVQADIELYLTQELDFITPRSTDIEQLVQRSGALFIYAATLARYIRTGKRLADPRKRLRSVLSMTPEATKTHTHIDALYTAVLRSALSEDEMEPDEVEDILAVLRTVISAQEPINAETIAVFAGVADAERVVYALQPLRSVLHQSEETGLISTLHASFPDFMFSSERSGLYFCDIGEQSQLLAQRCFFVMKEGLKFNICDLETSFLPDEKIENLGSRIKEKIPLTLGYACRYWASHLGLSPRSDPLQELLDGFFSQQLLFWMEVLSLHREMAAGVEALLKTQQWLTRTSPVSPNLLLTVEDVRNFVTSYAASPTSQSTPHIYVSSLPLCPRSSFVYKNYWERTQGLLKLKGSLIDSLETAALAVWSVASNVRSIAYAPDGSRFLTGHGENNMAVRNAYDGTLLVGPWQAHKQTINSVAFSPDGRCVASASRDSTVRVWNAYNGTPITEALKGHTNSVLSVSFSPDSKRIVSGSSDCTIRVWNAYDGTLLLGPLDGHADLVYCVTFSPSGYLIASASNDRSVRLWNSHDGSSHTPFTGHTLYVRSVAFTPDGTRLVSASWDRTIRVWNVADGSLATSPFEIPQSTFMATVSPDGTRIASCCEGGTIHVWNINDGSLIAGPFFGHTDEVISVAYSPDGSRLMSGSGDGTVRIWNVRDNLFSSPPFPPPKSLREIHSLAFSTESTHFSSSHDAGVIRIWDAFDASFTTGPVEARFIPAPLSTISPDSSFVAAISKEYEVQIMSTANGSVVAGPFGFPRATLSTFQFSHSGQAAIMGCEDGTIKIGTLPNAQQVPVASFTAHNGSVGLVSESPDCSLVVSYSEQENALRVWKVLVPTLEIPSCMASPLGYTSGDYSVLYEGWRITREGWVVNAAEQLLFWIPASIASAWLSPYAMLAITETGTVRVPKQKLVIGDEWMKCYKPDQ
ncbi:unnamed protein product [Rhizoctonia solani]|uniref:Nephrocystin 3-like N-terminal domain-containing protein n=1 Tax=Rhizoctonia solani TaxID=456999 RepID=A0A8H3HTE9_9AGAM|nr:unnamed protein product [Rhizoctonia solani]